MWNLAYSLAMDLHTQYVMQHHNMGVPSPFTPFLIYPPGTPSPLKVYQQLFGPLQPGSLLVDSSTIDPTVATLTVYRKRNTPWRLFALIDALEAHARGPN